MFRRPAAPAARPLGKLKCRILPIDTPSSQLPSTNLQWRRAGAWRSWEAPRAGAWWRGGPSAPVPLCWRIAPLLTQSWVRSWAASVTAAWRPALSRSGGQVWGPPQPAMPMSMSDHARCARRLGHARCPPAAAAAAAASLHWHMPHTACCHPCPRAAQVLGLQAGLLCLQGAPSTGMAGGPP